MSTAQARAPPLPTNFSGRQISCQGPGLTGSEISRIFNGLAPLSLHQTIFDSARGLVGNAPVLTF